MNQTSLCKANNVTEEMKTIHVTYTSGQRLMKMTNYSDGDSDETDDA